MKKMGVKRSKIWAHYTPCGLFKAKCLICHRAVSYLGGSTGNLSRHVRLKHGATIDNPPLQHFPLQESFNGEEGIQDAEVVIGTDWSNVAVEEEEVVSDDHAGYTVNPKARPHTRGSASSLIHQHDDESALFGAFVAHRLRQIKGARQRAAAHKHIIDLLCDIETTGESPPPPPRPQQQQQHQQATPVLFVEQAEWTDNPDQIQSILIGPASQTKSQHQ